MSDLPSIARVLATLAPATVRTGSRWIDDADVDALHPVERSAIAGAVAGRRVEFASGRALLRALIGRDEAIPVGPTRAPALPAGVVGSLSHDDGLAIAAVSAAPSVAALGIDVSGDAALEDDVARLILRPDETLDAHLAFCLKEAAYKAWSTLGGRLLDHHDVRLTLAGDRFTAVLDGSMTLDGRFAHLPGRWLALVVVDRR